MEILSKLVLDNGLLVAFVFVGVTMWLSYLASTYLSRGRIHGSAIAIGSGLALAYLAGLHTGGKNGVADLPLLAGVGILGGSMFRDFAIVATAFGVKLEDLRKAGLAGSLSIPIGVCLSFVVGSVIAIVFGYRDPAEVATIGAGAATYIVGPVTGASLGVSSEVISLSIAAGLAKSVLVMLATPMVARRIGLDNPVSAMVYGGLMGTTSGVTGGLAATDPKLVPYGAMTSTFYTGVGCLLAPSVLYLALRAVMSM